MPNPIPPGGGNSASRLPTNGGTFGQRISDTKFSIKSITIGVVPPTTDFFTSAPGQDPTIDSYDAGNQLVTSAKMFFIQGLAVNVIGAVIADVDAIIQKGVIVLTCQNKEIGRYRVRHLAAGGGTFVAGSQVAAANTVGVINGTPQTDIWRIDEIKVETNQSFKASLWMPSAAPYTTTGAVSVEIDLVGYEFRPAA